jgi:hypothetical protein
VKRKKQSDIRSRAILPFVVQFAHAVIVYVLLPVLLLFIIAGVLKTSKGAFLLLLLGIGVLWYFVFVLDHFRPEVQVLGDMIFNNFTTREIRYENNIIDQYHHFPLLKKQSEGDFLEVYCQIDSNQRLVLCASRYHGMISGEIYTVKYGKCSKVLISILSENGEELWDVSHDEWETKYFANFVVHGQKIFLKGKKYERKKTKNVKMRAGSPFLVQFVHAVMVYILFPVFLFILMIANLRFNLGASLLLLLGLGVLWYFAFVLDYFIPGVRTLSDIIFNNFETREIKYENSIINQYQHFLLLKKNGEGIFLKIYCKIDGEQRLTLCASRYHGMIPGERYTVKYGKHSKVLISILSENGEELWDVPPEEWRSKSSSKIVIKNKSNNRGMKV